MEIPRPTEAHETMARLAGSWSGTELMHPSPWVPEEVRADGRTDGRVALGGFAVIVDYKQERDGQVTFTGHGVYTYSAAERCYVLYWFDSMGGPPNLFKGDFEGDVLTLVSDESCQDGPRLSRLVYDLSKPGVLESRMEVSQDGTAWKVFMEATYTRED